MKSLVLGVALLALVGCGGNEPDDVIYDCSVVRGEARSAMVEWEQECRTKFTNGCNTSAKETFCKPTLRKDLSKTSINQTSIVNENTPEVAPAPLDQTQGRIVPND